MRELKFRAWDGKQMLYEDVIPSCSEEIVVLTEYDWTTRSAIVVEQYTGLKDKNGKEIYEGDIVEQFVCGVKTFKGKPCGRRTIWQVRWNEGECCFELHYLSGSLFGDSLMDKDDELEIIGNIHENPELLGEEE